MRAWPYQAFSLSLRDGELILAERGVVASSYETEGRWCQKFGRTKRGWSPAARPKLAPVAKELVIAG